MNAIAKERWKLVSDTRTYNYDPNYIKKPYHNPDLVKQVEESKKQEYLDSIAKQNADKDTEFQEMTNLCSNFYISKRNKGKYYYQIFYNNDFYGYQVNSYSAFPKKIYNFKKFKNSCQNFYKNNRLIKSSNIKQ